MKIAFFGITKEEQKKFFKGSLPEHQLSFFEDPISKGLLPDEKDFDIISVFVNCHLDKDLIDQFPNLKLITIRSTGFDNVDVKYAKSKNILASNVPAYGSHTVAEFTFALILSLSRKIPEVVQRVKISGEFSYQNLQGIDIFGKTLGVVGTGKIGLNVIKIASAFGMSVLAYDLFPDIKASKELNFEYVSLDELLSKSDIVTIHAPLNANTRHLINEENIFKMKEDSLLINTSRGGIISTDALFKALASNHLKGAALDVLEGEEDLKEGLQVFDKQQQYPQDLKTMLENHILIDLKQVIITPHMAFYTKEAEFAIIETTAENIKMFIAQKPQNLVD